MFWWMADNCKVSNAFNKRIFFGNCKDLLWFTGSAVDFPPSIRWSKVIWVILLVHAASHTDWNWPIDSSLRAFRILLSALPTFGSCVQAWWVFDSGICGGVKFRGANHDLVQIATGDRYSRPNRPVVASSVDLDSELDNTSFLYLSSRSHTIPPKPPKFHSFRSCGSGFRPSQPSPRLQFIPTLLFWRATCRGHRIRHSAPGFHFVPPLPSRSPILDFVPSDPTDQILAPYSCSRNGWPKWTTTTWHVPDSMQQLTLNL